MRVICLLDEILKDNPVGMAELEARLGLDSRAIKKLRLNQKDWRLTADAFGKLMLFGYEHGLPNGVFAIRPHPIWQTFAQRQGDSEHSAFIYRSSRPHDATVEAELTAFLQRIGCDSTTEIIDELEAANIAEIRDAMRSKNCVFIGSPKSNAASEIALCLLWDVKPFQSGAPSRNALPFQMLIPDAERNGASSVIAPGGVRHGFVIQETTRAPRRTITVTWKSTADYDESKGEGQDAAMIVVARSPLQAEQDVTSIVIAGYTGLATRVSATQLMMGEPPVKGEAMVADRKHLLAYTFQYRKPKRSPGARSGELRKEVPESGQWAPPWNAVVDQ